MLKHLENKAQLGEGTKKAPSYLYPENYFAVFFSYT